MDKPDLKKVIVANDADLILLCEGVELHVSSHVLSSASPMFKAMFDSNFLEGQAFRKNDTNVLPTISLPDDDSETMESV